MMMGFRRASSPATIFCKTGIICTYNVVIGKAVKVMVKVNLWKGIGPAVFFLTLNLIELDQS
jgi:hypothetical protein